MNLARPILSTLVVLPLLMAGCAKAPDPQAASLQNYVDRQAIETTLIRYSTGLDTFNAELYASAPTEDGVFAMEGKSYKGRAEIATVITDLIADRAKRAADADPTNDPPPSMHHVLTNAVIDITSPETATHHAYWMTVNGGPAMYSFRIAAQGRYEDELVKQGGKWLISKRKIL